MKYKALGAAMAALVLLCALAATAVEAQEGPYRVHQHLEARSPDAGCGCDGTELCTHLPLVVIDTGGVEIPGIALASDGTPLAESDTEYEYTDVTLAEDGSKTIACEVRVVDHRDANNHPGDEPTLETAAQIRIRGNTSRLHDKKGYLLRTTKDDGLAKRDVEMLGMDAHDEWALHGPYLDKSMMRNYMWYNIAGEMMGYAPNVRFCEVILNGEYQGLYVMVETITNGEGCRLNMTYPENDRQAEVSYVVRLDRGSSTTIKNINTFSMYTLRTLNAIDIVYPGLSNLTPERAEYIKDDVSAYEKSIYSFDYNTEPYAWWNYADTENIADYYLINEFTCNYDVGGRSTYLYKDVRGKYKMVIWDMNSSCDNFHDSYMNPQGLHLQAITWFVMYMRDPGFVDQVIERYRELRETVLSDEYMLSYIDDVVEYIATAVERNFEVWGYSFEDYRPLDPDKRNPDSFEEAVDQLKEFCVERGEWLDENIEALRQYGHYSANKKYNH